MTNDAIINKKLVLLEEDEKQKAALFHKKRIACICMDGKIEFNEDQADDRDHMHWVLQDYDVTLNEFEKMSRGYISKGKIFLYKGSDFAKIELNEITVQNLVDLISKHNQYFESETILVYSGMHIGKVGEIWEPQCCILIIENVEENRIGG